MARKVTFYTFTFMTNKKKITHVLRWGKPQNFLLAFIDELWKTWKIRILKKWKKIAGDIIILHMCTKNHNHMRYSSWDTKWDRIFCHFESFFALMPPNNLENQNFEKMTGFNLLGCDSWSTRFWIFMTEFFVIMSLFTKRQKPLEL